MRTKNGGKKPSSFARRSSTGRRRGWRACGSRTARSVWCRCGRHPLCFDSDTPSPSNPILSEIVSPLALNTGGTPARQHDQPPRASSTGELYFTPDYPICTMCAPPFRAVRERGVWRGRRDGTCHSVSGLISFGRSYLRFR